MRWPKEPPHPTLPFLFLKRAFSLTRKLIVVFARLFLSVSASLALSLCPLFVFVIFSFCFVSFSLPCVFSFLSSPPPPESTATIQDKRDDFFQNPSSSCLFLLSHFPQEPFWLLLSFLSFSFLWWENLNDAAMKSNNPKKFESNLGFATYRRFQQTLFSKMLKVIFSRGALFCPFSVDLPKIGDPDFEIRAQKRESPIFPAFLGIFALRWKMPASGRPARTQKAESDLQSKNSVFESLIFSMVPQDNADILRTSAATTGPRRNPTKHCKNRGFWPWRPRVWTQAREHYWTMKTTKSTRRLQCMYGHWPKICLQICPPNPFPPRVSSKKRAKKRRKKMAPFFTFLGHSPLYAFT